MKSVEVNVSDVVTHLRLSGQFSSARTEVGARKAASAAAREAGVQIPAEELQAAADDFRSGLGLHAASQTEAWLKSASVSVDDLESFLEETLLAEKFKDMLLQESDNGPYLESPEVKATIKEMVFQDWTRHNQE